MSARVRQPWTARKLKETALSMLGFMVGIGLGLPSLRQLGVVSESLEAQLRLLFVIPFVVAVVVIEKLFGRYRQAEAERDVARVILRAMDAASQTERAGRQEQDKE